MLTTFNHKRLLKEIVHKRTGKEIERKQKKKQKKKQQSSRSKHHSNKLLSSKLIEDVGEQEPRACTQKVNYKHFLFILSDLMFPNCSRFVFRDRKRMYSTKYRFAHFTFIQMIHPNDAHSTIVLLVISIFICHSVRIHSISDLLQA